MFFQNSRICMYPLFSFSNANIYIIVQKFKGNLWFTIRYLIKYTSAKKFVTICQCLKSVGFSRSSSLDDKMVTCQVEWKILRTILEGFFSDVLREFNQEVLQNFKFRNDISKIKPCNSKIVWFSTLFKDQILWECQKN